ncbi:MAG: hypothetical protein KAR20_02390, partial [Candidatus Heimdallarchaeota archaeon]|nr:hypothetical protein [Candidatus Heimdallarchaeota archaeon]
IVTEETFEYVVKKDMSLGRKFEQKVMENIETKLPGIFSLEERKYISENMESYARYINGKSVKTQMSDIQKMRYWNIYGDLMLNQGVPWTKSTMEEQIKKTLKIYKNIAPSQKEMMLARAKAVGEFYMNPKIMHSSTFQLFAVDLADDLDESFIHDNSEYTDELNAMATCPIMLGKSGGVAPKAMGTLSCAMIVSMGVMIAYIDNDNEKYNPVGINAIGYKTNYYDVQTEYLENIINYYYIALKRDDHQRETRFFLASPCKTEKVVVKHEIIECYVKECKNDVVCCNKTIAYDPYSSNGNGIEKELMWLPKDSCFGYPENYNALLAPSSSSTQNAYLFENKNGQNEVLYTDITLNTNNEIELKNQIVIGTFDSTGWSIDTGIGDEIVSDSECMTTPPAIGNCQGAFYETEPENYFTKEYYPLNYPYITTIDQYEGTGIEYKPGDNQEWFNTVEIKSSENYYKHNPSDFEISEEDYYIQFANAMEHNDEIQNSGSSSVFVPKLYMDSYGTGIKQCETNPKHIMTLWKTKTKTNIDALTVDVEFDYSFEGNNYCYAGKDLLASTLKGGAMLVTVGVAIVADIVLAGTGVGAMAIPAVNFITGAAYEGIVYIVDKSNAWPHR